MRYMMLIYSQENEAAMEDMIPIAAQHKLVMDEARRKGVFLAADPLQTSSTATTVHIQEGTALVTDGPYAETKEQLAGYYILDCQDLDEALAWAAKIPTACAGAPGCIEVRPIREFLRPEAVNG